MNGNKISKIESGNGGDLPIIINEASMTLGRNTIMIMATYPGCEPVALDQNISIKKEAAPLFETAMIGPKVRSSYHADEMV